MNQSMTLDENTIFKQKVQNMYTLSTGDFLYHNLYNAFFIRESAPVSFRWRKALTKAFKCQITDGLYVGT